MNHPLRQFKKKSKEGVAYCHFEEKWKPISCFSRYKIYKKFRDEVLNAVCDECLKKGNTIDKKCAYTNLGGRGKYHKTIDKC